MSGRRREGSRGRGGRDRESKSFVFNLNVEKMREESRKEQQVSGGSSGLFSSKP